MPSNLCSKIHSAIYLVNGRLMSGSVILTRWRGVQVWRRQPEKIAKGKKK